MPDPSTNNFGRQEKNKMKNIGNLPASSYTATCIHEKCIQMKNKTLVHYRLTLHDFPLMKISMYHISLLHFSNLE